MVVWDGSTGPHREAASVLFILHPELYLPFPLLRTPSCPKGRGPLRCCIRPIPTQTAVLLPGEDLSAAAATSKKIMYNIGKIQSLVLKVDVMNLGTQSGLGFSLDPARSFTDYIAVWP